MKQFFLTLPRNVVGCFKGRTIFWHLTAIVLTAILVLSGFDWFYFQHTRSQILWSIMFPSAPIGGLVPILFPISLIITGSLTRNAGLRTTGWAIGQAELIGSLISSTYKLFTGRIHPAFESGGADISHNFRFGLLRGGVFWGWPSSHTTIAFAMAFTIVMLFPKKRALGLAALVYAFYIGIGVSMTIHWFSDFAAGAIIGTVIGMVVGKNFSTARNS